MNKVQNIKKYASRAYAAAGVGAASLALAPSAFAQSPAPAGEADAKITQALADSTAITGGISNGVGTAQSLVITLAGVGVFLLLVGMFRRYAKRGSAL